MRRTCREFLILPQTQPLLIESSCILISGAHTCTPHARWSLLGVEWARRLAPLVYDRMSAAISSSIAKSPGVLPLLSGTSGSAPRERRSFAMAVRPMRDAMWRPVSPI